MLIWTATIILILTAFFAWVFFRKNREYYLYNDRSPINFFFKWGNTFHYVFKVGIIVLFTAIIFAFYKYILGASDNFAMMAAIIASIIIATGKELMDYYITLDDVIASIIGIGLGFLAISLLP